MRNYSASGSTSTRTARTTLDYTFVSAFPLSLTAIPVSYEDSQVLKCNVSYNFIRYVQQRRQSLFRTSSTDDFSVGMTRDMIVNKVPQRIDTWRDIEDEPSGFTDEFGNERF